MIKQARVGLPKGRYCTRVTADLNTMRNEMIRSIYAFDGGVLVERKGENDLLIHAPVDIVHRFLKQKGWSLNERYGEWKKPHNDCVLMTKGKDGAVHVEFEYEGSLSEALSSLTKS